MTVSELIKALEKYDGNLLICRYYEGCHRELHQEDFYIEDGQLFISTDE